MGYNIEMNRENNSKEPAIAGRLYQLMSETGMNKSGLARICGVSPQAAGRWFTKGKISKDSALKLSEAFGVSLTWLLSDDGEVEERSLDHPLVLDDRHRELLNLFDRLPESEKDNHIASLRSMIENYDRLFGELIKSRNIKEIMEAKKNK
ncbi:helix-turn-helix domain-containing protein [Yersinia intermedia]|uniref:helix-turn-helix domain-containing protein n=1 Tax=Yersinia intermedia TaxID=631 RepID=UPI0022434983|nr:helix-turn-helix domain-containing protein [Yersinia intermedia]MCW8110126.1 helix-turn-helix domain-containing protein [Yersinia intermedia]MDA5515155.1 helix-turn-helix domain-containing protein [Yersinia intermedia]